MKRKESKEHTYINRSVHNDCNYYANHEKLQWNF